MRSSSSSTLGPGKAARRSRELRRRGLLGGGAIRACRQRDRLVGELLREHGDVSVRDFLDGSGLEEAWRPQLHRALTGHARELASSEPFAEWLTQLVEN